MSGSLRAKWNILKAELQNHRRMLIAFSGGCDSAFLMTAARLVLGKENVLAVTAVSASLPIKERDATVCVAAQLDVTHEFLETRELEDPNYTANPSNRCFFCKNELFNRLASLAQEKNMLLADGFNASDRSDYRPGFQAAQKWQVIHPLNDANLFKKDIRALSRWLRVPTWNKPASPCLSSRIPYGTPVSKNSLWQIEQAEEALHQEGFAVVRVRHYGRLARVEVPLKDLNALQETPCWTRIIAKLHTLGYEQVEIDPRGFKSGRLNENSIATF